MDTIHSWIDEEEVNRLAKTLSVSPEGMKEWRKLETEGFAIPEEQGNAKKEVTTEIKKEEEIDGIYEVDEDDKLADEEIEGLEDGEVDGEELPEQILTEQREMLACASEMAKSAGLTGVVMGLAAVAAKVASRDVNDAVEDEEQVQNHIPPLNDQTLVTSSINTSEKATSKKIEFKGTFVMVQEMFSKEVKDTGLCVIDRDGDILYDSLENDGLSMYISTVMKDSNLMKIKEGETGSMRIKHSASEVIEFLSVYSSRGVVLVGARVSQSQASVDKALLATKLVEVLNS